MMEGAAVNREVENPKIFFEPPPAVLRARKSLRPPHMINVARVLKPTIPAVSDIVLPKPISPPAISNVVSPTPKPKISTIIPDIVSPKSTPSTVISKAISPKPTSPTVIVNHVSPKHTSPTVISSNVSPKSTPSTVIAKAVSPKPTPPTVIAKDVSPKPTSPTVIAKAVSPKPTSPTVIAKDVSPKPTSPTVIAKDVSPKPTSPTVIAKDVSPKPTSPTVIAKDVSPKPTSPTVIAKDVSPKPTSPTVIAKAVSPKPTSFTVISKVVSPKPSPPSEKTDNLSPQPTSPIVVSSNVSPKPMPSTIISDVPRTVEQSTYHASIFEALGLSSPRYKVTESVVEKPCVSATSSNGAKSPSTNVENDKAIDEPKLVKIGHPSDFSPVLALTETLQKTEIKSTEESFSAENVQDSDNIEENSTEKNEEFCDKTESPEPEPIVSENSDIDESFVSEEKENESTETVETTVTEECSKDQTVVDDSFESSTVSSLALGIEESFDSESSANIEESTEKLEESIVDGDLTDSNLTETAEKSFEDNTDSVEPGKISLDKEEIENGQLDEPDELTICEQTNLESPVSSQKIAVEETFSVESDKNLYDMGLEEESNTPLKSPSPPESKDNDEETNGHKDEIDLNLPQMVEEMTESKNQHKEEPQIEDIQSDLPELVEENISVDECKLSPSSEPVSSFKLFPITSLQEEKEEYLALIDAVGASKVVMPLKGLKTLLRTMSQAKKTHKKTPKSVKAKTKVASTSKTKKVHFDLPSATPAPSPAIKAVAKKHIPPKVAKVSDESKSPIEKSVSDDVKLSPIPMHPFCTACNRKFTNRQRGKRHLFDVHFSMSIFECSLCDYTNNHGSNNVKRHLIKYHHGKGEIVSHVYSPKVLKEVETVAKKLLVDGDKLETNKKKTKETRKKVKEPKEKIVAQSSKQPTTLEKEEKKTKSETPKNKETEKERVQVEKVVSTSDKQPKVESSPKKRGRPRKHPKKDSSSSESPISNVASPELGSSPAKKRGRPRKYFAETSVKESK